MGANMILCLDVGNSQIFGGVFENNKIRLKFRKISTLGASSDEYGLFLKSVLRENGLEPKQISKIAICSVVPDLVHSLRNCCLKYFNINPFILQPGAKSGLKIKYRNPVEVGADRISNAVAATHLHPNKNIIVIDFGTATTLCAITKKQEYLGGVIMAGLKISMEALEIRTAKLPKVEIVKTNEVLGRSTVESIQIGLFHGHYASCKHLTEELKKQYFKNEDVIVIGTGGFSTMFEETDLFDEISPDLVLQGLFISLQKNPEVKAKAKLKSTPTEATL
jgi:type III pantothenate kinase